MKLTEGSFISSCSITSMSTGMTIGMGIGMRPQWKLARKLSWVTVLVFTLARANVSVKSSTCMYMKLLQRSTRWTTLIAKQKASSAYHSGYSARHLFQQLQAGVLASSHLHCIWRHQQQDRLDTPCYALAGCQVVLPSRTKLSLLILRKTA